MRFLRRNEPREEELAAFADGTLSPERRAALGARAAASSELADRLAEQRQALALTQGAVAEVEAPASLRARIDAQRRPSRAPRRQRPVLIGVAAAAVVAVAIGVAVHYSGGTSAERFQAELAPAEPASAAGGEATLTKTAAGWRVDLRTTGLPRLDAGRFYEAWLRNAAGALVPIGTFNQGPKITLWAGVSPREFGTLTVTRERADGNQASSGDKVLVGTVGTRGSG